VNAILKWKLNHSLSDKEIMEIIHELYQGSGKKFVYAKNEQINMELYDLYSNFPNENNSTVLSFSMHKTNKPFISFTYFEKPSIILKGENKNVYIYE
jgi:hypothetical protein